MAVLNTRTIVFSNNATQGICRHGQAAHSNQASVTSSLLCAGLSLLSACGGGGGDKPTDNTADITPKSVSASFATIETRQTDTSGVGHAKLNVVNIGTGTIVRSYSLAGELLSDEYPSPDWHATAQYQIDADGLGVQEAGTSQLALIQNRKVMLLDLSGSTLGEPKQISSISDACALSREDVYTTLDGKHVWLSVTTAGPDGDCRKRTDNLTVLISSDMTALDASVASGSLSGLAPITALHDTAAQLAKGILALRRDTSSGKAVLSVYDNTLKTKLYDVTIPDHVPAPTEVVRKLVNSPTNRQQALIQLGASVYLADWSGAQLRLGTAPVATVDATVTHPVVIKDADTFYLGYGNKGMAISANGTPITPAFTFPAERGDIVDAWPTASGVVVKQAIRSASASSGPVSATSTSTASGTITSTISVTPVAPSAPAVSAPYATLWSINKTTGLHTLLASSGTDPGTEFDIEAVSGDAIFFSQPASASSNWYDLLKIDATGGVPQTIAGGIGLVDRVQDPHTRSGSGSIKQIVWCEPSPDATGCANSKLVAYNVATAQKTTLGNMAVSDGDWLASNLFGVRDTWAGRNGLIELVRFKFAGTTPIYTSEIWMINPDAAGSLSAVLTAP